MSNSVWPYDVFQEPEEPLGIETENRGIEAKSKVPLVLGFLATPYRPSKRWDDFRDLIQEVAADAALEIKNDGDPEMRVNIDIQVLRADEIIQPGIVHNTIWHLLKRADFVICDITDGNGNVMMELGVAARSKPSDRVIILQEERDEDDPQLFNIAPVRHYSYVRSWRGLQDLRNKLKILIKEIALKPTETAESTETQEGQLPFTASLQGADSRALYTPDECYRLSRNEYLEFGSPLDYRNSWMSFGDLKIPNVHIQADMKLTLPLWQVQEMPENNDSFIGVMARGSSFYANFGHLILVRPDGNVYLTNKTPTDPKPDDLMLGTPQFDIHEFIHFDFKIDDSQITAKLSQDGNDFEKTIPLEDLNHVFSDGRVFFIAGLCRAAIRNVSIQASA